MNTNFKNLIVASGFAGCAAILITIVSLATPNVNQAQKTSKNVVTKINAEKAVITTLNQQSDK